MRIWTSASSRKKEPMVALVMGGRDVHDSGEFASCEPLAWRCRILSGKSRGGPAVKSHSVTMLPIRSAVRFALPQDVLWF